MGIDVVTLALAKQYTERIAEAGVSEEQIDRTVQKYLEENPISQSDWNQNDLEASDYIKNRPFYSYPIDPIICDGTFVYETLSNGKIGVYLPDNFTLEDSLYYNIMFIDVELKNALYESGKDITWIYARIDAALTYIETDNKWAVWYDGGVVGESVYIKVEDSRGDTIYQTLDLNYLPKGIGAPGTGLYSWSFNKDNNISSGDYSHAEGAGNTASGMSSHAEGGNNTASGLNSHAEGMFTIASATNSHAEGSGTIAASSAQHAHGKYNIEDKSNTYIHVIGNGTGSSKRSNAHTLDWSGNAWYQGDVYIGSTSGTNKDDGSKKLATEEYVNTAISNISSSDIPTKTSELENDSGFITADDIPESGISIKLARALSGFFTDFQTLLSQLAYVEQNHIGSTLVSDAKTLVKILNDVPLTNLTATYSGGYVTIGTDLDNLRKYIVATGTYEDGTVGEVTEYELGGTIVNGQSTLTITSGDVSTTITVTGTPNTYLYSPGFEYTDVTGGWVNEGNIAYTDLTEISKDNNSLYIKASKTTTTGNPVNTYATKNTIDLTKYSKFIIDGEFAVSSASGSANIRATSTLNTDVDFTVAYEKSIVVFNAEKSTTTNGIFEVDLSTLDFSTLDASKVYITLSAGIWANNTNASCNVRNIYLVPKAV